MSHPPETRQRIVAEFVIAADSVPAATARLMEVLALLPSGQAYALGMRAAQIVLAEGAPPRAAPSDDAPGETTWFSPN